MIAAPYSDLLGAIADDMGWKRNADGSPNLDLSEFHSAKRAVSRAIADIWPMAFWRDLLESEPRAFAPDYVVGDTFTAGQVRYHPAARRYYLCLRDAPTTEPVALTDGQWVNVTGDWVEAQTSWAVSDAWDDATAYVVGDQVTDETTGLAYQCIQAHTNQDVSVADYWGQLIDFVPYVDKYQVGRNPIGRVEGVYPVDPRVHRGARPLPFLESGDRIQLRTLSPTVVWVRFMPPTPRLFGDYWDATATYQPLATSTTPSTSVSIVASSLGYRGAAALRLETNYRDRQMAYLLYAATDGDNAGGEFSFVSASTDTDDGLDVIKPDNIASGSPGRWVRTGNSS